MTNKKNIFFAIGVVFIAFLLAGVALVRPAEDLSFLGNLMYAPFVFFLIFFGTLWIKVLIRHLKMAVSNRWYVWFFISCFTFWWFGVQINHYLFFIGLINYKEALSQVDIFSRIDYLSWKTYVSICLAMGLGVLGLLIKEFLFYRIAVKKEIAFSILFFCITLIGFMTGQLFRQGTLSI